MGHLPVPVSFSHTLLAAECILYLHSLEVTYPIKCELIQGQKKACTVLPLDKVLDLVQSEVENKL